jgi:hypothetical protein
MSRFRRTPAVLLAPALALALALAVAACGSGDDLAKLPQTAVKQQVERYAGSTLAASGQAGYRQSAADVTGCPRDNGKGLSDPDDAYYVQGSYDLPVPTGDLAATMDEIRAQWQRSGYTLASATTGVSATTPDAYRMDLTTGPADALSLSIASPCYRPA